MKKECFTCINKVTTILTAEQRVAIRKEMIADGVKFPRVPELIFHCEVSGKRIKQTDTSCKDYSDDTDKVKIRKALSETCKKLRQQG